MSGDDPAKVEVAEAVERLAAGALERYPGRAAVSIYQATALVIEAVRLRGGGDDDLGTVNPDAATATWLEVLTKLKWKLGPKLTPAVLDALLEPLKVAPFR